MGDGRGSFPQGQGGLWGALAGGCGATGCWGCVWGGSSAPVRPPTVCSEEQCVGRAGAAAPPGERFAVAWRVVGVGEG